MLLNQGIFAAFHSNYVQEFDLGLSSSRINMELLRIWGLFLQNWLLSTSSERKVPWSISKGEKKETSKHWEAVKSPQWPHSFTANYITWYGHHSLTSAKIQKD